MIICALKLTHDGTVALIDGDRLIASVEVEKLENRARHAEIEDLALVPDILSQWGCRIDDVDQFVVDGWVDDLPLVLKSDGLDVTLQVAPYQERNPDDDLLRSYEGRGLLLAGRAFDYTSYTHVAGHVAAAWASSPFAERGESAFVLVWDGGMLPRLYHLEARTRIVRNLGPIFYLVGHAYAFITKHFGPFREIWRTNVLSPESTIAGTLMAFIAHGTARDPLLREFEDVYSAQLAGGPELQQTEELHENDGSGASGRVARIAEEMRRRNDHLGFSDEDVLTSFHAFLERRLVEGLRQKVGRTREARPHLCLSGGCALNVKWNSALRGSGLFDEVWVPPFPNDAGSAIGAGCSLLLRRPGFHHLRWTVFSGPHLRAGPVRPGWTRGPCTVQDLARRLHETGEPVVFLTGRAELGPRALGHRSLLAPATSPTMKDHLNAIKGREHFRPVAPICLEERAFEIFDPGTRDPYMLFEHQVRPAWRHRVPAIVHRDGSARLQTVSEKESPAAARLLREYDRLSGIPLLCNTSANFKGCSFFPDVASAMRWGAVRLIWSEGELFERH